MTLSTVKGFDRPQALVLSAQITYPSSYIAALAGRVPLFHYRPMNARDFAQGREAVPSGWPYTSVLVKTSIPIDTRDLRTTIPLHKSNRSHLVENPTESYHITCLPCFLPTEACTSIGGKASKSRHILNWPLELSKQSIIQIRHHHCHVSLNIQNPSSP